MNTKYSKKKKKMKRYRALLQLKCVNKYDNFDSLIYEVNYKTKM